jgi:antitoxin (DNA-binding transcriptional repressor) of toxin-antitoxin stability system
MRVTPVEQGHSFILTYRGKPVARIEPIGRETISSEDPIYSLAELAVEAGSMTNEEIDELLYKL